MAGQDHVETRKRVVSKVSAARGESRFPRKKQRERQKERKSRRREKRREREMKSQSIDFGNVALSILDARPFSPYIDESGAHACNALPRVALYYKCTAPL